MWVQPPVLPDQIPELIERNHRSYRESNHGVLVNHVD
jgi:hypothetical protein